MNRTFFGFKGVRALAAGLWVVAAVAACVASAPSLAQDSSVIQRAQEAVRERILREQGYGGSVNFPARLRTETYPVGNNQTGVRGEGVFRRDNAGGAQRFTYDAVVNTRNGRVQRVTYNFTGDAGGGGYDDGNDRVPRWLIGTFRGYNPAGRQGVTVAVTVDSAGNVTITHPNGSRETGRYENGQFLFSARPSWEVTRSGRDGFRASTRRRAEEFVRDSGGGYDGGRDDRGGRVPNWAVGTFRGQTDSGESELNIRSDGSVTIRSLRTGESFYGTMDDRRLRFDWGEYDVTRERDGIRTTNINDRTQTLYRRY